MMKNSLEKDEATIELYINCAIIEIFISIYKISTPKDYIYIIANHPGTRKEIFVWINIQILLYYITPM